MSWNKRLLNNVFSLLLAVFAVMYVYPIFMIFMNSLKKENSITTQSAFKLPVPETFGGFENYLEAIQAQGFLKSFGYSMFITVSSVAAILLCCSMCAWYLARVKSIFTTVFYYLCIFSMVVPFQMIMFTLASTADVLKLNKPWNIFVVYLGFGAGLAVFMITGFMKSIPIEVEEAAVMDGCNPLGIFFNIVMPMLKPTLVSVGILEAMWIWNDYLLPTLVLDIKKYKTIPMLIQYFRGSYGRVEMGAMMASIILTILPIVVLYLAGQKHIIKGVASGAVKG